jgi:hypothetical protein
MQTKTLDMETKPNNTSQAKVSHGGKKRGKEARLDLKKTEKRLSLLYP